MELPRFSGRLRAWVSCSFLVAPLEGDGGLLTKAPVTTMGVIPSLDELEDCASRLVMVVEVRAVEQLAFEGGEEALGHGVVEAVPDRAHRRDHAPSPAAFTEGEGGGLAALDRTCAEVAALRGERWSRHGRTRLAPGHLMGGEWSTALGGCGTVMRHFSPTAPFAAPEAVAALALGMAVPAASRLLVTPPRRA